jgi:hypothetical protein
MNTIKRYGRGRTGKILATCAVIGAAGAFAGIATFSAFSSSTTNSGNSFAAGSVTIGDNDAGSAMYVLANQKPGAATDKCIKVTYTGSLDADVRLYTPSAIGALGPYVNLTVTPGTQASSTFPDCTGFVADSGGAIYSGTLAAFATAHNSSANGLLTYPGGATKWVNADAVVYRFSVSLADNDLAQGQTTGAHSFVWQAQNQ